MYDDALNQMRRVGSDAQGAIDYVLDMASTHPNRVDVCAQRTTMRAPGAPIRPPFEVQPPKAFMGSNPPPAQAAPTSAPPAAPAQNTVARGTRFPPGVGLTTQIAFAGQQARQVAPYGPAAPAAQPAVAPRNPFGAPTAPAQANPFAAAAAANPFTSATRLSVPTQPSVAAPANPFVSAAQTAQARNAAPTPANPFAATAQPVQPPNAARPTSTNPPAASGRAITMNNPYPPDSTFRHPDINEYSTRDANNRLLTWKGKPVTYVDGKPCFKHDGSSGAWVRIWNPDGPPPYNKNTEMPLAMYDERTKEAYIYLRDHGRFKDGWIPMLPPRREWSRWDF